MNATVMTPSSQAGHPPGCAPEPFLNNLEHLNALEQEASLLVAATYLRRNRQGERGDDEPAPKLPLPDPTTTPEQARELLAGLAATNRAREQASGTAGIALNFLSFCAEWRLDSFEQSVVMLLLMQHLAPDYSALMSACGFEKGRNGMKIGTMLALLCPDLSRQLECRRYFSVVAPLMHNDIIALADNVDDTSNILDEKIYLAERYVRYILGDNNLYNSCFRYIKQEKSTVRLEQVILPDRQKEEIVTCVQQYLTGRSNGVMAELDTFFGYGTALTLLFHGAPGTGKTMLARALAARFSRPVFSLTADDMRDMPGSYEEILGTLFREAALQGALVFLDECDDLFADNGRASRALLIELEKARCVVIMATNKPVSLDPALERRITMKVYFAVPQAEIRHRMWQTLLPESVRLAPDVDLAAFANRYHFTGGLIRNSILLAVAQAAAEPGTITLTADQLHQAAARQSARLADEQKLCSAYVPTTMLAELPLRTEQIAQLRNVAEVWRNLHQRSAGLVMLLEATDTATAISAANGIAHACGLSVRAFDYRKLMSVSDYDRIADPVQQKKVPPLEYAFASESGDTTLLLAIDEEGQAIPGVCGSDRTGRGELPSLLAKLRGNQGFFCLVTRSAPRRRLPTEFNLVISLVPPDEEQQLSTWQRLMGDATTIEDAFLQRLPAAYPLHAAEIEYVVRQAGIQAMIRRRSERPLLSELQEVLSGYLQQQTVPLLFGNDRTDLFFDTTRRKRSDYDPANYYSTVPAGQ